ncbi:MAG TPA: SDR family NAD(P)-dependent oxidoreductase [Acidimicrobiales bacterium]
MARVLITGSTDGLGLMTSQSLIAEGHQVTLHARNEDRAAETRERVPHAEGVVVGDVADLSGMRSIAEQANAMGRFDAVIHNVGVGYREPRRETHDGLSRVFAINVLAPYVLTALINPPNRLVYLSSGMHQGGEPDLSDLQWTQRRWNGAQAYSDSKLFDVILAFAVARHWPTVLSNALDPGWVATKMGGPSAPDNLSQGSATQVWLAVSDDPSATVSGEYFFHRQRQTPNADARDTGLQDDLLTACAQLSDVHFT